MTLDHLGIVGFGGIGRSLAALLAARLEAPLARLDLLVRPRQRAEAEAALAGLGPGLARATACHDAARAFLAARPALVVECAGHSAVREVALPALAAGIETAVASIGALADEALEAELLAAARAGGARLVLPAGAVGGIDLLAALAAAGALEAVRYRGVKPPAAWRGTPAETLLDLDGLAAAATFFEGDARTAARDYPRNANVAATVALAGLGFERTAVALVADPAAEANLHEIAASGPAARFAFRVEGVASAANPRTSQTTAFALAREVLNRRSARAI